LDFLYIGSVAAPGP